MLCLAQGGRWIRDAHGHGERGDSFQNGQTQGGKEGFEMPVMILPQIEIHVLLVRAGVQWGPEMEIMTFIQLFNQLEAKISAENMNQEIDVRMRTRVCLRFDLMWFWFFLQSEIKILRTSVFVDPYEEADAQV